MAPIASFSSAIGALFYYAMKNTCRFIVGLVFLLSALLKSIDTASFADLMSRYGAQLFGLGAPILILVEFLIGIFLLFNIRPRTVSIVAAFFLCIVTAIYLYGVTAKGITDCGCFGPLTWLNSRPWLAFLRNGVLLALLIPSFFRPQEGTTMTTAIIVFVAVIGVIIMFMCGFSFRGAKCLNKGDKFKPVALADSPLSDFVSCRQDSTYLIFAFSYSCPYCLNSIGNVNQYQPMGAVDKVIGLAVADTAARKRFERLLEVNFEIRELSDLQMLHLATTLPTTYVIRHDSVVEQHPGMVVSPALLLP